MIPLIIPNFNQHTYLRNLVNWWHWYSKDPVYVLDNGSSDKEYKHIDATIIYYEQNNAHENLKAFLSGFEAEYYCISDPDIMPHPNTPMDFLDIFKHCFTLWLAEGISVQRVGFNLISDGLPDYLRERETIVHNEKEILKTYPPIEFEYEKRNFTANRTPIDTTFAMYRKEEGFYAPMSGLDWSRSLRLFDAFHLGWHVDPERVNDEMDNYFKTCIKKDGSPISAGKNNNCPQQYLK